MKLFKIFVLIVTILKMENAVAEVPSIKPDWSNVSAISLNLSGNTLHYKVPGRLSTDYPSKTPSNKNIYDPDQFQGNNLLIDEKYWDYKRKIFFLEDVYGRLEMRVVISKYQTPLHSSDVDLQQEIIRNAKLEFSKNSSRSIAFITGFEQYTIHNTPWLRYKLEVSPSNPPRAVYSTTLTQEHYVSVYFKVIESKERHNANWYATALSDIEKIMNSFEIKKGTENTTIHKQFKVNLTPSD